MTEKEILERAAAAMLDNGEALMLAVKLRLKVNIMTGGTEVTRGKLLVFELTSGSEQRYGDAATATRIAISKAATEIVREMKEAK